MINLLIVIWIIFYLIYKFCFIRIENKFIKYTTKDIFTEKETYIYENLRTLEKINSNNPNLLEELNTPKKKKIKKKKEVGVPISSMTFSFKKEK